MRYNIYTRTLYTNSEELSIEKENYFGREVIFVCEICKRMPCQEKCPNYLAKNRENYPFLARRRCVLCGDEQGRGVAFYVRNGFPYCVDCLLGSDVEGMVRICEMNEQKWLQKIGFLPLEEGGEALCK